MDLINFLEQISDNKSLKQNICFTGKQYQYLFFAKLFYHLNYNKQLPADYKTLNFEYVDKNDLQANLTQTFLGQTYFYWLSQVNLKSNDKKSDKIFKIITQYQGPHFISFYIDKNKLGKLKQKTKLQIIEINDFFYEKEIKKIINFFEPKILRNNPSLEKFLLKNGLNLDKICILMQYLKLVKNTDVLVDYLAEIFNKNSPSLNLLVKHFFENNPNEFFEIWSKIENNYPEIFWISFWAEKIYKAFFIVQFLQKNDFQAAKSLSFGIPHSFIKKDWKKFSLNSLSKYHDFLYTNDYKIKIGSKFCSLELFYLNHFNNQAK